VARDERYFRSLNERIVREIETRGVEGYLPLVCECGDPHCFRLIRATREEFDALRAERSRYAIYPGHETLRDERLLDSTGRFTLVEKFAS
jgi:hypothetical protein